MISFDTQYSIHLKNISNNGSFNETIIANGNLLY